MEKKYTTFEQKIKDLYRKYSRLPLLGLVGIFTLVILVMQINDVIIKPKQAHALARNQLEDSLNTIHEYFESLTESEFLRDTLAQKNPSTYQYNLIYYRLNQITGFDLDYAIYRKDNTMIYSTQNFFEKSTYASIYNEALLNRLNQSYSNETMVESFKRIDVQTRFNMMVIGKHLSFSNDEVYSFLIYVDPSSLSHLIDQYYVDQIVITDRFGYVINSSSDIFKDQLKRFNPKFQRKIEVENIIFNDYVYEALGGQINIHALNVDQSFFINYGLLITFMLLGFIVFKYANDSVGKKVGEEAGIAIKEIVSLIDKMKHGQTGDTIDLVSHDELGYLIEEFNDMSKELDSLIKRNESLIELRNQAQIKQLEAQFNPHFLYNSLDTIRFLIQSDPKKAIQLIHNLTYLLRYSIDISKGEVTLKEDLDYVYKYLEIIKIRLNERFSYHIDIEESVLSSTVPRLLIQPLIENSVKHGFKDKDSLQISIYGSIYQNHIYIGVHDSGSGMSEMRLNEIIETFKSKENPDNYFGLYNLNQRLKLLYGEEGALRITSSFDGTNIVIKIPKEDIDV